MEERILDTAIDIRPRRYQGWLTSALITLLLFHPVLENSSVGTLILVLLGNIVVLTALYAVSWNNRRLAVGLLLALPNVIIAWSFFFHQNFAINIAQIGSEILFFTYTLVTILQRIFKANQVSLDELFGALNVFILIGVTWGLLYSLVEAFSPGAFLLGDLPRNSSTLIYFSFSTLGTLGLGDVRPVLPFARALTVLEMLVGLFFMAVSFGKLVAIFRLETVFHQKVISEKQPFERSIRLLSKLPRWSLIFIVAAANLLTSVTSEKLQMPLFLDTWATSVGTIIGGLGIGLLGGVIYNLLMAAFFWGHNTWVWAFNTMLVAVMTRFFWNRNLIHINRPFALMSCGLAIAGASSVLGIVIVNLAGLPRNTSTLELHNIVLAKTENMFLADVVQQLLMESMDKVVSLAIAMLVVFAINEARKPSDEKK